MPFMDHFIKVFTDCNKTCLPFGVSQSIKGNSVIHCRIVKILEV